MASEAFYVGRDGEDYAICSHKMDRDGDYLDMLVGYDFAEDVCAEFAAVVIPFHIRRAIRESGTQVRVRAVRSGWVITGGPYD